MSKHNKQFRITLTDEQALDYALVILGRSAAEAQERDSNSPWIAVAQKSIEVLKTGKDIEGMTLQQAAGNAQIVADSIPCTTPEAYAKARATSRYLERLIPGF